jgi:hypothetical protein
MRHTTECQKASLPAAELKEGFPPSFGFKLKPPVVFTAAPPPPLGFKFRVVFIAAPPPSEPPLGFRV